MQGFKSGFGLKMARVGLGADCWAVGEVGGGGGGRVGGWVVGSSFPDSRVKRPVLTQKNQKMRDGEGW